jgi:hypothetical protein
MNGSRRVLRGLLYSHRLTRHTHSYREAFSLRFGYFSASNRTIPVPGLPLHLLALAPEILRASPSFYSVGRASCRHWPLSGPHSKNGAHTVTNLPRKPILRAWCRRTHHFQSGPAPLPPWPVAGLSDRSRGRGQRAEASRGGGGGGRVL